MTSQKSTEDKKKESEHKQSLQGVLTKAMGNSEQKTENRHQGPQPSAPASRPYEVPEDALRDVLSGE